MWSAHWTGTGGDLEAQSLWPVKSPCLPVLLCSALSITNRILMATQTKTGYFLPAQYIELACGGIEQTPDSVILTKVKLQRPDNRSVFPAGYDQHDFDVGITGLATPFQVRFKQGSCTLWHVSFLSLLFLFCGFLFSFCTSHATTNCVLRPSRD